MLLYLLSGVMAVFLLLLSGVRHFLGGEKAKTACVRVCFSRRVNVGKAHLNVTLF